MFHRTPPQCAAWRPSRAPSYWWTKFAGGRCAANDAVVAKRRRPGEARFNGRGDVDVLVVVIHREVRRCGHSRPCDRPRFVGRRSEAWLGGLPRCHPASGRSLADRHCQAALAGLCWHRQSRLITLLVVVVGRDHFWPLLVHGGLRRRGAERFCVMPCPIEIRGYLRDFYPGRFLAFCRHQPAIRCWPAIFRTRGAPHARSQGGADLRSYCGSHFAIYLNWLVRGCFLAKSDLPDGFLNQHKFGRGGGKSWDHISSRAALPGRPISSILVIR